MHVIKVSCFIAQVALLPLLHFFSSFVFFCLNSRGKNIWSIARACKMENSLLLSFFLFAFHKQKTSKKKIANLATSMVTVRWQTSHVISICETSIFKDKKLLLWLWWKWSTLIRKVFFIFYILMNANCIKTNITAIWLSFYYLINLWKISYQCISSLICKQKKGLRAQFNLIKYYNLKAKIQ